MGPERWVFSETCELGWNQCKERGAQQRSPGTVLLSPVLHCTVLIAAGSAYLLYGLGDGGCRLPAQNLGAPLIRRAHHKHLAHLHFIPPTNTVQGSTVQYNTAEESTIQLSTVHTSSTTSTPCPSHGQPRCTVLHSAVQCNSTVLHGTPHCNSTVHCKARYSTLHYRHTLSIPCAAQVYM